MAESASRESGRHLANERLQLAVRHHTTRWPFDQRRMIHELLSVFKDEPVQRYVRNLDVGEPASQDRHVARST
jgi:hypothetical protein